MDSKRLNLCGNKAVLIAYLYNECSAEEREWISSHLMTCTACAQEIDELKGVRSMLTEWAPAEPEPQFQLVSRNDSGASPWWYSQPVRTFGLAAAALLVTAVAVSLINLEITYGPDGLLVRTGWTRPATAPVLESTEPGWRKEFETLAQGLREEFAENQGVSAPEVSLANAELGEEGSRTGMTDNALVERVQGLVDESEQRQQRELALRFAQLLRETEVQRQADLLRIDQQLGELQGFTEAEVVQHHELMDYLVLVAGR